MSNLTGDASNIEQRFEEFKQTLKQAKQNTEDLLLPSDVDITKGRSVGAEARGGSSSMRDLYRPGVTSN